MSELSLASLYSETEALVASEAYQESIAYANTPSSIIQKTSELMHS